MSADHESSYYEIALTNRQVLTIFVVLLTCLVAAFLSGVWIGRRDGGEGALQASAGEPPADPETAQMTELNFFSDGPSGDGGGAEQKAAPRPPVEDAESPAAPPPAIEEQKPPPAQQPPATASPTPSRPPAPPTAQGGRVIQVFSTLDAGQADRLVKRLGDGGYPAYLVEENLQGRTTYRVRVGPYQQEDRARKIADELRREYRLETWITSQPG